MNQTPVVLFGLLLIVVQQAVCTTPPTLTYGCKPGTPAECKKARFVPGHTLLGEGLNIVTMKTMGVFLLNLQRVDKKCTLCNNPHLKNVVQKLPKALVDWRPETSCSRQIQSSVSDSTVAVANAATSSVTNDWKVGLDVQVVATNAKVAVGGSHSKMAEYADNQSLKDKYSYLSHSLKCTYYSFHLASDAPLTPHFAKELKKLPATYDKSSKQAYRRFIDIHGTHYITNAKVGGHTQEVTAVRSCEVTMDGMTVDEVKDCLNAEAEISASTPDKSGTITSEVKHCSEKLSKANRGNNFHQAFKERNWDVKGGKATFDLLSGGPEKKEVMENWMESLKTDPGLVSYSLDPIHNLVKFEGPQKEYLRLAVGDYIKEMAIRQNCSCSGPQHASHGGDCSCSCSVTKHTSSNCCPTSRNLAKVHVTIDSGKGLYGDVFSKTDAYVRFKFGSFNEGTKTIWNNNNPKWGQTLNLDFVDLAAKKTYKIEVWDEDNRYDDDLLGSCEKPLSAGETTDTCYLNHGSITYSIKAVCSTYLSGPFCQDYNPVPPK